MLIVNKTMIFIGSLVFGIQFVVVMLFMAIYNTLRYLVSIFKSGQKPSINPLKYTHPDVFMDSMEMITLKGFKIQEFEFKTEDDYTVLLWRLINHNKKITKPYPIVLQHGLLDCSISWFLHQDKSKALPYILSNQGFDVWIGNNRGTKYSMQQSKRKDYWEFSFDHLAEHDVPTIIEGVLKQSKKQKIIYVGHSQGSTQLLISLCENLKLSSKIHSFIALGPVISLRNVQDHAVIKILSKFPLLQLYKFLGFKTLLHLPPWMNRCVGILIYNTGFYFQGFFAIVNLLCGYPSKNKIDLSRFGVIIAHEPGGASTNNILQWIQFSRSKKFRKFDHGKKKNILIYGQQVPPEYNYKNLKNLQFNKHLFIGTKDSVISGQDFKYLESKLHNQSTYSYQLTDYAHLDYLWSVDAHLILYQRILQIATNQSLLL